MAEAGNALSKFLSYQLRHGPDPSLGMDGAGWVSLDAFVSLAIATGHAWGMEDIARVVAEDPKGRFAIRDGRLRANSGHSFDVDLGLDAYVPTGPLWFGTVGNGAARIEAEGFQPTAKKFVRLLEREEDALAVALSRQKGEPVVFRVDAEAMARDGLTFQRAENGEILSPPVAVGYVERVRPEPLPSPR